MEVALERSVDLVHFADVRGANGTVGRGRRHRLLHTDWPAAEWEPRGLRGVQWFRVKVWGRNIDIDWL